MPAPLPDFLARFAAVVAHRGDASAIETPDASWTFEEAWSEGRHLSARLRDAGVREGDVVGLALGRTSHHVIAVLATWFAGAAFLPLDPAAPEARVETMLRETRARALLTLERGDVALRPRGAHGDPVGAPGDALAYVLYTSGSTGRPKGVRVSHRGLCPVLLAQIEAFAITPGKRVLFGLSTAFDASISDLGTALLAGATLVIEPDPLAPRTLVERLHAGRITHADLPPSLLPLVDPASLPPCLETVVIGGEACAPRVVRSWARRVRVVNVYGPTEATICTSLGVCDPAAWSRPRIGEPLPHVVYDLDDGELLIGGPALALGYVERPEIEATRFVVRDGQRWYRTGDLVRPTDEGLEFLGRRDRQVKVRGRLVCPEEIEAQLRALPEVLEAVVDVKLTMQGARLTAWVVPVRGSSATSVALRRALEAVLPAWMVPRIALCEALPRGPSGKLAAPASTDPSAIPFDDPLARTVAEVFEEVLGVVGVRPDDDARALGADSLAAVEIAASLQLRGLAIDEAAVLTAGTPIAIARARRDPPRTVADLEALGRRLAGDLDVLPARSPEACAREGWLVTGATGFLGRHLLPELLARTAGRVHCLVRAPDDAAARHRLGLLGEHPRVVAHAGDVASPRFAAQASTWRALLDDVGHVLHLAASTSAALPFAALERTNLRGAVEVARFVRASGATLHHVSSLAVLASTDLATIVIDEGTVLPAGTRLFGAYAQTKAAAEMTLRCAVPHLQILRPGLLTGCSSTGRHAVACPLASFLAAAAHLGCLPRGEVRDEHLRVDITPVDAAARALAEVVTRVDAPRVLHLASERGASLADLVRVLEADGGPLERVPPEDFLARARDAVAPSLARALLPALARLARSPGGDRAGGSCGFDLFLHTGRTFPCLPLASFLGRPLPPVDDALLARYASTARGLAR